MACSSFVNCALNTDDPRYHSPETRGEETTSSSSARRHRRRASCNRATKGKISSGHSGSRTTQLQRSLRNALTTDTGLVSPSSPRPPYPPENPKDSQGRVVSSAHDRILHQPRRNLAAVSIPLCNLNCNPGLLLETRDRLGVHFNEV